MTLGFDWVYMGQAFLFALCGKCRAYIQLERPRSSSLRNLRFMIKIYF